MKLVEHIEKYLGEIRGGDLTTHPIYGNLTFPYFLNQPFEKINTHLTLGLNKHILDINKVKQGRIELLISLNKDYSNHQISEALLDVSDSILKNHIAPLRGSIIENKSDFFKQYKIDGFYVTHPVFFEEEFWIFEESDPSTIFIWLIPLFSEEINFIKSNGWNKFEDLLETADCDFWNLERDLINVQL